jgi:phosphate transport system protein
MPAQSVTQAVQQLEEEVLALGNLAESILLGATDLLREGDLLALERLKEEERQVHRKRLAIEMGCLSLIATGNTLDGSLQHLVAMVEIAAELERLTEHARRVARTNYLTAAPQLHTSLVRLHHLSAEVQSLLDAALTAFARRDAGAARAVAAGTRKVESSYQQIRCELLAMLQSKPRIANQAVFLSRSAYNLRRAAERVVGICEWAVFAAEGSLGAGAPGSEGWILPPRETCAKPGDTHDTSNL